MKLFNEIAIVGVGLIGGSLALAIRKRRLANAVIGVSRHRKTLLLARKNKAIDNGSQDLKVIKDADLVILATSVSNILNLAPKIRKLIKKECIVTDAGSTKQEICAKLGRLFPKYVGSHPLAGSQKRGVVNASPDIFQDSLCILTPTKNTDKTAQDKIKKLWNALGVKVVNLSPATHDKILSLVSHLPHIVAFSLISAVPKKYFPFASSGLRDTTRIAASDAQLWCDIFFSNQKFMLEAIDLFQKNLSRLKSALLKKDKKLLTKILKEAKKKRDTLV